MCVNLIPRLFKRVRRFVLFECCQYFDIVGIDFCFMSQLNDVFIYINLNTMYVCTSMYV